MTAMEIANSEMVLTCFCGHVADFWEFTKTPIRGDLPPGHYQCPRCKRAWKIERAPDTVGWSGMVIPGDSKIVDLDPTL